MYGNSDPGGRGESRLPRSRRTLLGGGVAAVAAGVTVVGWPASRAAADSRDLPPKAAGENRLGVAAYPAVVAATGDKTGAKDVTALQSALTAMGRAGGGTVKGAPGKTYYINTYLVIPSNVTLDMSGCIINAAGSSVGALVRNYAAVNPAASATDGATTSGSSTITTSLGASAAAGQSVVVAGAGGTANVPLVGYVSAATATTITITNLDGTALTASQTVSGAAISLYTRDSKVRLRGGTWNSLAYGGYGAANHKIVFAHCDESSIDTEGVTATTGVGYLHLLADTRRCYVNAPYVSSTKTGADGVHVQGPCYGLTVERINGTLGDDGLSLTASDYTEPTWTSGNIVGVRVNTVDVDTAERCMIMIAGAGNYVDDIHVFGGLRGSCAYILIGDDTNESNTEGGTYGSIDLEHVAIQSRAEALRLVSPAANRIRVNFAYGAQGCPPSLVSTASGSATRTLQRLEVTGACITGSAKVLSHTSTAVTLNHVVFDKFAFNSASGAGYMCYMNGAVTCNYVDFTDCFFQLTTTGSASGMFLNNSATGVCDAVNIQGGIQIEGNTVLGDNSESSTIFTVGGGFQTTARYFAKLGAASTTGTDTVRFNGCYLDCSGTIITINTKGLVLEGSGMTYNTSETFLTRTQGTEAVHCRSFDIPVDISQLSRSTAGDRAFNSNASLAAVSPSTSGEFLVGPCVSTGSGSSGSWVSLVNTTYTY